MPNKKEKKKKTKRNKGRKFVYRKPEETATPAKKNLFEEMAKTKFRKQGKQFAESVNDYNSRNDANTFVDKRLGEGAKNLSKDEKMKMRFKAQQLINMKSRKNKFSLLNDEDDGGLNELTHRGRLIGEDVSDDQLDRSDDENYNMMENYMEELDRQNENGKLSRKEIIQNMINRTKQLRQEKQRVKDENRERIETLDDNFSELNSLLKKRGRSFNKKTDDYDMYASKFSYTEKTHPTQRVKSEEEILLEKEMENEKRNRKKILEELEMISEDEEKDEAQLVGNLDDKKSTKKERIEKLIQERLNKKSLVEKEDLLSKRQEEDDQDDDDPSDLNEFDEGKNEGESDSGDFEEDEEGEAIDEDLEEVEYSEEGEVSEKGEEIDSDDLEELIAYVQSEKRNKKSKKCTKTNK